MKKIIRPRFFNRSPLKVADNILGKYLVYNSGAKEIALLIADVEAYDGPADKASHAHRGRTERNMPMFGAAGHWYLYLIYGRYWMLNIVTGPKNYPAAILIRGAVSESKNGKKTILNGPGKITEFLKIGKTRARKTNGAAASRKTGLWIEDRGRLIKPREIIHGPRIGVQCAADWANKPWRRSLEYCDTIK